MSNNGLSRRNAVRQVTLSAMRFLIGNKADLPAAVDEAVAKRFADEHQMAFYPISCMSEKKFVETWEAIFDALTKLIPALPKPEQLFKKHIAVGKKLLQSSKYQLVSS